ncbi:hypothetical protein LIPSTDRAFT_301903 [Lipomyces starkeyi NRRL Y-11557]|uniref:Uncharacterized protein n=1 Tax=Lipomyces starkeyi NRRL Y-11557 TaxID=675824 RepID=A0A1E3Q4V3_LIPST|nr:hypothetical protein LIPSTDRAFT_301903 [Lipomyces starkeyi NRRL Y-11557]
MRLQILTISFRLRSAGWPVVYIASICGRVVHLSCATMSISVDKGCKLRAVDLIMQIERPPFIPLRKTIKPPETR